MIFRNLWRGPEGVVTDGERLLQNLRDYADAELSLIWQRQAIFAAAALLTSFFFDPLRAAIFYSLMILSECYDLWIARVVARLSSRDAWGLRRSLFHVFANTVFSSSAICAYVVSVASMQGAGGHFTPLFFLFAAALFAAMNNHQIVGVLVIRLTFYGTAFLFITVKDLLIHRPPLSSDLWLHFFTVIFVMYFLIDCSLVFLRLYRRNLQQLEELKAEHERTKAALVVKSQFVSVVSHELRTPLTSIKGSLDLMVSGRLGRVPDQMAPLVQMASKNSSRLATLIDDLLDLQKIEAGEMTFKRERIDVRQLVADALAANQGLAEKFNVRLRSDTTAGPPVFILADEARLMQVMSNMISNAAKFSPEGGDVLAGFSVSNGTVRIHVTDHGVGIPEGARDKVFDRFSQLDSSDQRRAGGTGLGMNISREIVEAFGGTIDYESELGRGTTFFIDLPACAAEEDEAEEDAHPGLDLPRIASG